MKKLDPVVKKETLHILCGVAACSAVMQLAFVALARWDPTVLAGGLLGGGWAVLNFLLMGVTVQNSVGADEVTARNKIKASYSLRTLGTCAMVVAAILAPCFHWVPAVAAIFYPRLTIAAMGIFRKEYGAPVEAPRPVPPEDEEEGPDELERLFDKVYGGRVDYAAAQQTTPSAQTAAAPSAAPAAQQTAPGAPAGGQRKE